MWPNLCGGGYIVAPDRTSVELMIVSQNMRGRGGSLDLEMELAESDEVQVKQRD